MDGSWIAPDERYRAAHDEYRCALIEGDAGLIELDADDDPQLVLAELLHASAELGVLVLTGWVGITREALAWRRWEGSGVGWAVLGVAPRPAPGISPS